MIAFTSQLAHVVSSAYIKVRQPSTIEDFPPAVTGIFPAAKLNEDMWTELLTIRISGR